ncbi:Hypothetical protein SCF082_LOCUS10277 [Durusdinium trenchii]|uniref:Uncharacterized protein n=1 Tax=Durusdinium trenchii TaxID=1381693 RepID=A0ABP0J4V6_9DINO
MAVAQTVRNWPECGRVTSSKKIPFDDHDFLALASAASPRLARLLLAPEPCLAALAARLTSSMGDERREAAPRRWDPQGVANWAWSMAKLQPPGDTGETGGADVVVSGAWLHHVPLFAAVRAAWRRRADEFEAQSLANVAWGWAALELRSGSSLMAEVADRARQQMSTFRALPLTNLLWASAVLRCRPEGFMTAASERTQQLIHEHNPQQIANSFWTVAKLSLQNPPLHECLRAATAAALAQFDGSHMSGAERTEGAVGMRSAVTSDRYPVTFHLLAGGEGQEYPGLTQSQKEVWRTLLIFDHPLLLAILTASRQLQLLGRLQASSQHVANLAWTLASAAPSDPVSAATERWTWLAESFLERMEEAKAQEGRLGCIGPKEFRDWELASTAWAFAKAAVLHRALFQRLAARVAGVADEWDARGFATLAIRPLPLLTALGSFLQSGRDGGVGPQEVGTTAWSYATLAILEAPLLAWTARRTVALAAELEPQNSTNVAWAVGTVGTGEDLRREVFEVLGSATLRRIDEFHPQNVSNMAWTLGNLLAGEPEVFGALERAALRSLGEFSAQGLANSYRSEPLLAACARALGARPSGRMAQAMANTAWGFATLAHLDPAFLDLLGCFLGAGAAEWTPQQVANSVWTVAALSWQDWAMLGRLLDEVKDGVGEMSCQGLANSAWSVAKLGSREWPLMDALGAWSARRMGSFDAQNSSNAAWGFAKLGVLQEPLMAAMSHAAVRRALQPREVSSLAWAFGTLRRLVGYGVEGTLVRDGVEGVIWMGSCWCRGESSEREGHDPPLFASLSAASEFDGAADWAPLDVANGAWGFDAVSVRSEALWQRLAQQLPGAAEIELQPLATLVDLDLGGGNRRGRGTLEAELLTRVEAFWEAWSCEDAFSPSNALLTQWRVDNLGVCGTTHLLSKLGVLRPSDAGFAERALALVRQRPSEARSFAKERAFCYVEYDLQPERCGSILKENSFHGVRAGRVPLLKSWRLSINEVVDRSLCAEFQALAELGDVLGDVQVRVRWRGARGAVRVWVSSASCLSCVRAIRQFLQLFPGLSVTVQCSLTGPVAIEREMRAKEMGFGASAGGSNGLGRGGRGAQKRPEGLAASS